MVIFGLLRSKPKKEMTRLIGQGGPDITEMKGVMKCQDNLRGAEEMQRAKDSFVGCMWSV